MTESMHRGISQSVGQEMGNGRDLCSSLANWQFSLRCPYLVLR